MNNPGKKNDAFIDIQQVSQELRIRPEIYLKILKSFAESLPGKMSQISNALALNNTDQVRMILHEIKGTSSNLRAQNVLSAETIMHVAVKSNESSQNINKYFENLSKESEKLLQFINNLPPLHSTSDD